MANVGCKKDMMKRTVVMWLAALVAVSMSACSRTRTTDTIGTPRVEYVPAAVVVDEPIGSDKIATRYYTHDGAPIYTPPNDIWSYPVTQRTIDSEGRVIAPKDGIRIVGELALEEFTAILASIENYSPKKLDPKTSSSFDSSSNVVHTLSMDVQMPLTSQNVHAIFVKEPSRVEVRTIAPKAEGFCPNGDNLELRKKEGTWHIKRLGFWVS